MDTTGTTPFDPRRALAAATYDPACTYTHNSIDDAAWRSVLFRLGSRQDPSGSADLGVSPHPRVMLMKRGSVAVTWRDDDRGRPAQLVPGRSWLVPAGAPLRYDWTGAGGSRRELAALVLPQSDLLVASAALADRRGGAATLDRVLLADDPVVRAVMTGMLAAVTAGADDLYAESASAFLVQHLLITYGTDRALDVRNSREDSRVQRAVEFIRDGAHEPLTLADMAAAAGLSPYHFLRVFTASTGETPRRFLTRVRTETARRLLLDPELSIGDVGRLAGFGTSSHFATAFRRETGQSPSQFRARHRNG